MTEPIIEIDLFPNRNRDNWSQADIDSYLKKTYLATVGEMELRLREHVNTLGRNSDHVVPAVGRRHFNRMQKAALRALKELNYIGYLIESAP